MQAYRRRYASYSTSSYLRQPSDLLSGRSDPVSCHRSVGRDSSTISSTYRSGLPTYTGRSAVSTSSSTYTSHLKPPKSTSTTTAAAAVTNSSTHPKGTCDKCDGAHLTQNCHIFKKDRERHPDATRRRNQKDIGGDGGDGPGRYLSSGRVVAQPGDGSCLFHSLCYGLGDGTSARCDAPRCWPLSDVHCKGAEARDS